MTATWAPSPVYGITVALGPVQRAVYDAVMELTTDGRRPELTLGELAVRVGRPVSSVHDALGRLRALGLIGVAVRMGRNGGHRLWRVVAPAARTLDPERHRRAVARIMRRWAPPTIQARFDRLHDAPAEPSAGAGHPGDGSPSAPARPHDPGPDHPYPVRPDVRETFAEKMRRHGLGEWIQDRDHAP